ncbi:hypothetical protein GWI33_011980 [Rhynchophorus ferrugineus]|uniref:Uncharacterized protein n=1 Tax=Rhynchophorus ferrugineus TaxID=354439 RepID=A0A834IPV0_RHYFE|nr:hypothetical protein GWI33_011980 [Rhynchophorus ferrugineus]
MSIRVAKKKLPYVSCPANEVVAAVRHFNSDVCLAAKKTHVGRLEKIKWSTDTGFDEFYAPFPYMMPRPC